MTLFIAILLIAGFKMESFWILIAIVLWIFHYWSMIEYEKYICGWWQQNDSGGWDWMEEEPIIKDGKLTLKTLDIERADKYGGVTLIVRETDD